MTSPQEERKLKVTYLGPEASYTHQASLKYFPSSADLIPKATFGLIFDSLQTKTADYGIVPIENSSNGPVASALDLFANASSQHPDVRVVGEERVRVEHCLVGHRSKVLKTVSSNPDASISEKTTPRFEVDSFPDLQHINELYTHPQAWGQCTKFLEFLERRQTSLFVAASSESSVSLSLPTTSQGKHAQPVLTTSDESQPTESDGKPKRIDAPSTSSAASIVAKHSDSAHVAAISSALAAKMNGIDVILSGLEDRSDNVTRFLVLTHRDNISRDGQMYLHGSDNAITPQSIAEDTKAVKALIVFDLARDAQNFKRAGALADALDVFRQQGCNLTSINARPSGKGAWDYWFVVECEIGMDGSSDDKNGVMQRVLHGLKDVAGEAHLCGTWRYQEPLNIN